LSVNTAGSYGERGQVVGANPITVYTRGLQSGATYGVGIKSVQASVGWSQGIGSNSTNEGKTGAIRSWGANSTLSATFGRWATASASYLRGKGTDQILDFGNYDVVQASATAQGQAGRFALNASWGETSIERGKGQSFGANRQVSWNASGSYRLARDAALSADAGAFRNTSELGMDRTQFYGVKFDAQPRRTLRVAAWARREQLQANHSQVDQRGFQVFATTEYRLRFFSLGVEFRRTNLDLTILQRPTPYRFAGNQLLVRLTRKFGMAF
jgi:hypothetical protein